MDGEGREEAGGERGYLWVSQPKATFGVDILSWKVCWWVRFWFFFTAVGYVTWLGAYGGVIWEQAWMDCLF